MILKRRTLQKLLMRQRLKNQQPPKKRRKNPPSLMLGLQRIHKAGHNKLKKSMKKNRQVMKATKLQNQLTPLTMSRQKRRRTSRTVRSLPLSKKLNPTASRSTPQISLLASKPNKNRDRSKVK